MLTPISPRHIGLKVGEVIRFSAKNGQATIQLTHTLNPGDGLEIIREGKDSVGTGITKVCEAGSRITCQFDKYVEVGSEVYLTKNHQLLKRMRQTYVKPVRKMPITMQIKGDIGKPLEMTMIAQGKTITYTGGLLEVASQNPITKEQARKQLTKLGSTSFVARQVEIDWPEGAYIGISQLNEVRRSACLQLEEALLEKKVDQVPEVYKHEIREGNEAGGWAVHVTNLEQLEVVLSYPEVEMIYWEWLYQNEVAMEAMQRCIEAGKDIYLALPKIMKERMYEKHKEDLLLWKETALTGFLIRNIGQHHFLQEMGKALVVDYNMNITNNETIALWEEKGAKRVTTSLELTATETALLKGAREKIVYGYFPVMTSSQCVLRGTSSCQKGVKEKHSFELEDRKQITWRIETDCKACMMQIMSCEPLAIRKGDMPQDVMLRIQLTNESNVQTEEIMNSYLERNEQKLVKGTVIKTELIGRNNMGYFNIMILLSRYIFAGFGILFVVVAFSFMKPFVHYNLGARKEKNRLLSICLYFFHLAGVSILMGKQTDEALRLSIGINGLIMLLIFVFSLLILKMMKRHQELVLWQMMFFIMDIGFLMLERLNHDIASKQMIAYILGAGIALIFPSLFSVLI